MMVNWPYIDCIYDKEFVWFLIWKSNGKNSALVALRFEVLGKKQKEVVKITIDVILV